MTRPQRWDVPFGRHMTDADVDRVLGVAPFDRIDPKKFSPSCSLGDIIKNDCRILRLKTGDIVVREGDYGNSAFFVLAGAVRIIVSPPADPAMLGRRKPQRRGFFGAIAGFWSNPKLPEVRDPSRYASDQVVGRRGDHEQDTRVFLQDVPAILEKHQTKRIYAGQIEQGDLFGEIAALGRTPRTATVFAEGDTELLEIRWQGLKDIRRRAVELKEHIDRLYRERSLSAQIRETTIFRHLDNALLQQVADRTEFETYGEFDWYGSFKSVAEAGAATRLEKEPIIAEEGHYPSGIIIVRAGFARLSKRLGNGHRTVSYLGRGQVFGFEEIVHNWRTGEQVPFEHTLRAVGYVDVLVVPTRVVEDIVLPNAPPEMLPGPLEARSETTGSAASAAGPGQDVGTDLLEFLVDTRFINGTAAMIIDLDRCTRCDDCVRACASTHDNNPRFIRHGLRHGDYMIANACMHCADPVCMIGCPTGAIHRDIGGGQVVINDATCIGCSTCANNCPYHNIRMVEIRGLDGKSIVDLTTNAPITKATKCDLCVDQPGGPACERACPHDALKRVNISDLTSLRKWVGR